MKQFLDLHQKNVLEKNMPNLFLKSSLMFDWLLWFGVVAMISCHFSAGLTPSPISLPADVVGTYHHVSTNHGQQNTGNTGGEY